MNQDQISIAATRVALVEQSVQAAEADAQQARDRLAALIDRRGDITKEISTIRGNRPAGELKDSEDARVHVLSLDEIDLHPLIEAASNAAIDAAAKVQAETMALGVARHDLTLATLRVEAEAIEQKARDAEKVLVAAIAELGALKRKAGINWRVASDLYRVGYDLDRLTRLGVIPPVEAA
jgi:hypothetical protein